MQSLPICRRERESKREEEGESEREEEGERKSEEEGARDGESERARERERERARERECNTVVGLPAALGLCKTQDGGRLDKGNPRHEDALSL